GRVVQRIGAGDDEVGLLQEDFLGAAVVLRKTRRLLVHEGERGIVCHEGDGDELSRLRKEHRDLVGADVERHHALGRGGQGGGGEQAANQQHEQGSHSCIPPSVRQNRGGCEGA